MSRSRASRVGLIYILIWLTTLAISLWIAYRYHLGVAALSVSLLTTVATVYLTWEQLKRGRSGAATVRTSAEAAEKLATDLRRQWEDRRKQRAFNVLTPLPVSWEATDDDLIADWAHLAEKAESGPSNPPTNQTGWAAQPNALDGSVTELRDVLSRVPTGRLMILGERGTGKTILLMHLVRRLLEQRRPGDLVPVLLSLASWNRKEQTLSEWLDSTLTTDFDWLRERLEDSKDDDSAVQTILNDHRLLLVLDGLDEMLPELRRLAIDGINKLDSDDRVIISSRIAEYHAEIHSRTGPVENAVGIVLRALDTADVKEYLCRRAGNAGGRWDPVLAALGTTEPIAQVLSTPLMVDLARRVYNSDLRRRGGQLDDPAELVDTDRLRDIAAIERHLFNRFIEVAYPDPEPSKPGRWQAKDARQWLEFLAQHQERQPDDKTNFAWWELPSSAPRALVGLVVGSLSALATGLAAGFGAHVGTGFGLGLGAGIGLALAVGLPIYLLRRSRERPLAGLAYGLAGGLIGGLAAGMAGTLGIGYAPGPLGGLAGGIGVGVGAGPTSGRLGGFVGCLAGGLLAGMLVGVGSGLPAGIVNGLGVGLGAGLIAGLAARPKPAQQVHWSPIGLIGGLAAGIAVGLAAWSVAGSDLGLVVGLVVWLASAIASGMARIPVELEIVNSPNAVLSRDRRAFAVAGLSAAAAVGLVTTLLVGLAAAREVHVPITVNFLLVNGLGTGVAVGFVCGLVLAFVQTAWGSFAVAHYWLAARRLLPWHLDAFLSDAHEKRDILRQVGARYQFRHLELQRHLAAGDEPLPQVTQNIKTKDFVPITTKDFLQAPTGFDPLTYRLVRPSDNSEQQLYPYIDPPHYPKDTRAGNDLTREQRTELYTRWHELCPDGFMHLEKFVNDHWRPIAISIILPLSHHGYRAITVPNGAKRSSVVDLDESGILNRFETKKRLSPIEKRRFLFMYTWIVDWAYRSAGHGKTDAYGGYANTLVLKHISVFWNSSDRFRRTTFLVETDNQALTPMLESMTFSKAGMSKIGRTLYETDTSTFESLDDTKLGQIRRVIKVLEEIRLTDGTAPQPRDWVPAPHPTTTPTKEA